VSTCVVDASVAAKWFLPPLQEPLINEAFLLLDSYTKGQVQFIVPDLFWAEIGNLLWKACRQGRCTKNTAELAITSLKQRNLPTVPSDGLLDLAFSIATTFDRTIYDCLYIALAVQSNSQFITADERLANALAAHFPVKWLGAI